ncbi:unnamed protein product, partial [Dicrocoelium dendriticum]
MSLDKGAKVRYAVRLDRPARGSCLLRQFLCCHSRETLDALPGKVHRETTACQGMIRRRRYSRTSGNLEWNHATRNLRQCDQFWPTAGQLQKDSKWHFGAHC